MNVKQDTTLDILYNNKLKYFQNKSSIIIPKITKKMDELKGSITPENEKEVKLKLEDYENKIQTIINEKNKYFLDNSKYLFEYFESKQNIDKNNTPKKTITSFFNFKEEKESVSIINNDIQSNYLEQIVLLLNEILDVTIPFEEKI